MNPFLILLGLYVIAGSAVALIVHRARQSHEDYFIGGRRISGVVSALTYAATTYSAFMMVGLVGLSFQTGIGALIFELSYLVGTVILLMVYGRKIWRMSREKGLISPMEMFSLRYGRLSGILGTVIAILALIPYTSGQVIGLALIFRSCGGFNFTAGAIFAAFIVAFWALSWRSSRCGHHRCISGDIYDPLGTRRIFLGTCKISRIRGPAVSQ